MNYTRERKIIIMMHNDKIEEKLKTLPDNPGVYLMKNSNGKIIYVGKAVVLKNRVRQYFRKTEKTARIEKMVSLIHDFEYIITDTEDEALILECNLIKKYKPKFNVLLKDDKTYPYIKVGEKNGRPLIQLTRNLVKDGSKYYGPYPSVWSAKEMIKYIKDIYMSILNRPFLDETLKNEEKEKIYQEIECYLGNIDKDIKKLKEQMEKASDNQEFERAIELRDRITNLERAGKKQKVSNFLHKSIDVIGIAGNNLETHLTIFEVRGSNLDNKKTIILKDTEDIEQEEIIENYIMQTYGASDNTLDIPEKIMVKQILPHHNSLEKIISEKIGNKVEIIVPKKGEKLKFVELAEQNSQISLKNSTRNEEIILNELKQLLSLKDIPRRIEMYDISNISGDYTVAGIATLINGKISKKDFRKFNIKETIGQNDFASMKEIITRRLKHTLDGKIGLRKYSRYDNSRWWKRSAY